VIEYCKWLSEKNNREYRLASSDEWDYIAGKNKPPKDNLDSHIWHKKNTKSIQPVATKKPGKLGIYDMYGNVNEWCLDRKIRGGSINNLVDDVFTKDNDLVPSSSKNNKLGFRVVIINN
jgi:hypothetical protein